MNKTVKLLDFQEKHLPEILRQIRDYRFSLNASDTGTGKTFLTLAALQHLPRPTLVVAPRGLHSMWEELLLEHGIEIEGITSIEKLRYGNTSWVNRIPPPPGRKRPSFRWGIPSPVNLIFDEVHVCSGPDSMNAWILAHAKPTDHNVFALSATAADSPAKLRALGFHMGLHNFKDFEKWAIDQGCFHDQYNKLRYAPHALAVDSLKALHHRMFPRHGVRMRIADIPDFPENTVIPLLVDDETPESWVSFFKKKYPEVYDDLAPPTYDEERSLAEIMEDKPEKTIPDIVIFLRNRQRAEFLKIHFLLEKTLDLVEEGYSVAIFLNFKASIEELRERLVKAGIGCSVVTGDIKAGADRDHEKKLFQDNVNPVFLGTPGAGGVGISLHDLNGRPRRSLMSPGFNTVHFKQTLGRIHRAGGLSPSIQYVICVKGTVEEFVQRTLKRKVNQLSLLQDGDLAPEL